MLNQYYDPEADSRTVPKVAAARDSSQPAVTVASSGDISTATNSTSSTPRTSLLPSSALHPSQSIWSHSISAPQLPVKPPLPRPCSAQSLPTTETPGSTRNLGALLPVSSLSAFPERLRSPSGSMLASALSPVEVEGSSPASLPLSSLDAEKLQALAEASEDRLLPSESLKNAVVKIEAVYSETLRRSNAARDAALKAQKEAEAKVEELQSLLLRERQERQKEKQAWQEAAQSARNISASRSSDLPPTAQGHRHQSPTEESHSNSAATSLTTSLVSSDHSGVLNGPKGSQCGSNAGSLAASDDRGSPKRI